MGGHGSQPLGWTVLALVVVAYAHVILDLAAAGLALAIATRVMTGTPWRPLVDRVLSRHDRWGGRGRDAIARAAPTPGAASDRRDVDPAARNR
jgi:hypothetical protein